MKKALSLVLFAVMLVGIFAVSATAAPVNYSIPKATTAPTIDGKITGDEYKGALVREMKKGGDVVAIAGSTDTLGDTKFQLMWGDEGIYFVAEVADTTMPSSAPASGTGAYNSGDGVQFNIYTSAGQKDTVVGDCLFFSYHPKTDAGIAEVGEHFVYGTGAGGAVPTAKIASVVNGSSYTVEGLIPKDAFSKVATSPIELASGAKIYMNLVIMEMDDAGTQSLIIDNADAAAWVNSDFNNIYTMVDTAAGPSPEAPTDETPAAPQTSDAGIMAILGLLAASAIAFAVVKKSRNRA